MLLADGEHGVRWFPALDPTASDAEPSEGATTMPLFPLGVTYLPWTQHTLNIFEPRYRAMYNDILMSGARRFMVTNVEEETGRLAETGSIFYLDDLKEVSGQTQDRVKYVGEHTVKGRVKLLRVLNPSASVTRETYLKAEVAEIEDVEDEDADEVRRREAEVAAAIAGLIDVQAELDEAPRFSPSLKETLTFGHGSSADDPGLWGTLLLWTQVHSVPLAYIPFSAPVSPRTLP